MVNRTAHFLKAAVFALIVIGATAYIVNDITGTKIQRLFYSDIDLLHDGDIIRLSQMNGFNRYNAICAFAPDAIDYRKATEADLKKIFGAFDYSAWKDDLFENFADDFSHGP